MSRRGSLLLPVILGVALWTISRVEIFRLRLAVGRLLATVPDRLLPNHFTVQPPPLDEYVGIWDVDPSEARTRLRSEFGFRRLLRAYFHYYDRNGEAVHEVGSYVYRPSGFTGTNQLHVRLFPTADNRTELWCHWELNPNVSPLAHLRMVGYDPASGERRLRELLADESLSAPESGRPPADDS